MSDELLTQQRKKSWIIQQPQGHDLDGLNFLAAVQYVAILLVPTTSISQPEKGPTILLVVSPSLLCCITFAAKYY